MANIDVNGIAASRRLLAEPARNGRPPLISLSSDCHAPARKVPACWRPRENRGSMHEVTYPKGPVNEYIAEIERRTEELYEGQNK